MHSQGLIAENIVSFYFNGRSGNSYVDFGPPKQNAMRGGTSRDLVYLEMTKDDFFWSSYNQAIGIGSTQNNFIFGYADGDRKYAQTINSKEGMTSVYSIFDTGLSAIMISGFYFDDLIKYIFKYIGGDSY